MSAGTTIPSKMRSWTYSATDGGFETHLELKPTTVPTPSPNQHLVQVLAVGLNPVDYKPAEAFIGRFMVKKPATPGFDIAGRMVTPAQGSDIKPGQIIYGAASLNPMVAGGLAEYIAAPVETVSLLPVSVKPLEAAGAPIAAVTALDSLSPYVRAGTRVFINGGSGGVGSYGIQIAKVLGAHVTVSCSGRNIELVKSLGADEVLDYTKGSLLNQLQGRKAFDVVIDNVFNDPELYFQAHTYTTPAASFVEVASGPSLTFLTFALKALLLPGFLGGGKRKFAVPISALNQEKLDKISRWMVDGQVRNVVDSVFKWEDVVEAYKMVKTGRARGKVIVNVAGET